MRQIAVASALLLCASAAFAADPQLLNMVMPDAKILAGVNGTNTRISPFGQYVIAKVAALNIEPQKLIAATGFDPLQDLTEVLAASNADASNPSNLLLVEGNFNVEKIVAVITARGKVQVQNLPGTTVLSMTNTSNNKTTAVAFIGNAIAVAGSLTDVEAALMRNAGAPSAIDPGLAAQVSQLSGTEDEWLVSSVSIASLIPASATSSATGPAAQVLPLLKSIQSFDGGVNFSDNIVFTGQATANSEPNAAALGAVIKLVVTLASSTSASNAQLTQLAALLQTLQVTTNGSTVNLSLSVPETQIEAFLNQVLKQPNAIPAERRLRRRANGN